MEILQTPVPWTDSLQLGGKAKSRALVRVEGHSQATKAGLSKESWERCVPPPMLLLLL